jgi:UDP-2-acetamido-2,6-beta-L-arabino-hexul-4-ose reductase
MKVLITGSNGFVGKNLIVQLGERNDIEVQCFTRADDIEQLPGLVKDIDFVFHLAGVNRPQDPEEFKTGNTDLTRALCDAIVASGKRVPVLYTSSSQAELDNPYGNSKRGAEELLEALAEKHGSSVYLLRLPNVFHQFFRCYYGWKVFHRTICASGAAI